MAARIETVDDLETLMPQQHDPGQPDAANPGNKAENL